MSHSQELDKFWTGLELLNAFQGTPYRALLNSEMAPQGLGRYTIFAADPFCIFRAKNDGYSVLENRTWQSFRGSPLDALQRTLERFKLPKTDERFPFNGGAIGSFSYDLCHAIESIPRSANDSLGFWDIHLAFYEGAIVSDHVEKKSFLVCAGIRETSDSFFERTQNVLNAYEPSTEKTVAMPPIAASTPIRSNLSKQAYIDKVEAVKAYIASGDIYQVNLAQRFEHTIDGDFESLFAKLCEHNPAPFANFIECDPYTILGSSPERFLKVENRRITTRPIKGTRARGANAAEDALQKEALLTSEKERAELLMIVDLERNDLGRVCETGSVKVDALYQIETYPSVFHLVGEVSGKLRKEVNFVDLLKATFPGGSITGAPKVRAMEIIDSLEPDQRGIFTGSVGFIDFNGDIDLNIVIRTLLCYENRAYLQLGAGIVWDSSPEHEYQETLDKGAAIFRALGVVTD